MKPIAIATAAPVIFAVLCAQSPAQQSEYTVKVVKVRSHQSALTSAASATTTSADRGSPNSVATQYTMKVVSGGSPKVVLANPNHKQQLVQPAGSVPLTSDIKSAQTPQNQTKQVVGNDSNVSPMAVPPVSEADLASFAVATVSEGAPRSALESSDEILRAAPPLKDYQKGIVGSGAFKAFLRTNYGDISASKDDILIFHGKWDKAEHLLDECGLAYSSTNSRDPKPKLAHAAIAVINCPGELSDQTLRMLSQFVKSGGYLISTDWALEGCIAKAFPGYLTWKGAYTQPETVDAVPVAPNDSALKGLSGVAPWRLADKCQIVELGGERAVDILVRSRSLMPQDPNRLGILAASFRYGQGKVLHLVGHFDNNEGSAFGQTVPDPKPDIKISLRQAVAINFIAEALQMAHKKN